MKKIVIAAALAGAATPALAQEKSAFDGFYLGITGGYDEVTLESGGENGSEDGFVFGGVGGVDIPVGQVVFGAEVELTESSTGYTVEDVLVDGDRVSLDAGVDFYVGARAGLLAGANTLIYVKGGFTTATINAVYNDGDGFSEDEGENMGGFRVGAGVELAVSPNMRLRGEYRYSDYGEFRYNDGTDVIPTGIEVTRSQIVAGLLFEF